MLQLSSPTPPIGAISTSSRTLRLTSKQLLINKISKDVYSESTWTLRNADVISRPRRPMAVEVAIPPFSTEQTAAKTENRFKIHKTSEKN
jgi:hypothetical protein